MKNLNIKFISTGIAIIVLSLSGCLNGFEPKTEISNPLILVSQNIDYFDGYGNVYPNNNPTRINYDDENYLALSGDCTSSGKGIILSNFSNSDLGKMIEFKSRYRIINATLIVNFKTCENYNSTTFIEWSIDDNFLNSTIQPENVTSEITKHSLLFQNRYEFDDLYNLKIRYFNPQGGLKPVFIYFDYIWIEISYEK